MRPIDADAFIDELNVGVKGFEAVLSRLKTDEPVGYFHRPSVIATIKLYEIIKEYIERQPTVERPRGEWISVEDRLPEEDVAVLIWSGCISVAKLEKGITMAEREAMKRGEIDDPESEGWNLSNGWFMVKRSDSIRACDEWGNNLKPYCWAAVDGMVHYFGQNVKYWMPLPEPWRGE